MELSVQKQTVAINEVVFDNFAEHPLEHDVLLPDYCPDILKILKCEVTSKVNSNQITGDRLTIDAVAVAKVFYMTEGMTIRCNEYKIPFTKTCDLKMTPHHPIVTVSIRTNYVNCRAVSQRRLEIRGAVTLHMKVINCASEEMVSDAQGMGIQLRRETLPVQELSGKYDRQISVHEELELGYGKPPIGVLIHSSASAAVTDYKVISGKVVAKGELRISVLYYCEGDDKKAEHMEYSLPVSQIIDCDGVDDESICFMNCEVLSCDLQPKPDLDGETRALVVDAVIGASVLAHRKNELTMVSDSYSTQYEVSSENKMVSVMNLTQMVDETHPFKGTIALPEDILCIVDAWCKVSDIQVKSGQNEVCVMGKVHSCILALDAEQCIQCFERSEDFEHTIPLENACEAVIFDPYVQSAACSYMLQSGNEAEIRCEIKITGCIYCVSRQNILCDIQVDATKEKACASDCALHIYYADKGESAWEIAKTYHTAIDCVMEENGLTEDILKRRLMLLIPIV